MSMHPFVTVAHLSGEDLKELVNLWERVWVVGEGLVAVGVVHIDMQAIARDALGPERLRNVEHLQGSIRGRRLPQCTIKHLAAALAAGMKQYQMCMHFPQGLLAPLVSLRGIAGSKCPCSQAQQHFSTAG